MNNADLRVIKTRKIIKDVFFDLMEEKGFSKITVQEIVERAQINRSTFYAHYFDKFDLLDKLEDEFLSDGRTISQDAPGDIFLHNGNLDELKANLERFARYIRSNGNMLCLLTSDKGDPAFINKLRTLIDGEWRKKDMSAKLSVPCEYAISALIGLVTGFVFEWVKGNFKETPEEFVEILTKFIHSISDSILLVEFKQ